MHKSTTRYAEIEQKYSAKEQLIRKYAKYKKEEKEIDAQLSVHETKGLVKMKSVRSMVGGLVSCSVI